MNQQNVIKQENFHEQEIQKGYIATFSHTNDEADSYTFLAGSYSIIIKAILQNFIRLNIREIDLKKLKHVSVHFSLEDTTGKQTKPLDIYKFKNKDSETLYILSSKPENFLHLPQIEENFNPENKKTVRLKKIEKNT